MLLEIILKPAGWHAWLDKELELLQAANRNHWSRMGVKVMAFYQWVYGPRDADDDNEDDHGV